ncbi:MAG: peptidylprolyl isomerase [Halieaceae bacterium]|nr:peptidylprolyl isomerase [Halieaceae bacterium]
MVCHGCYDAPCQLKLEARRGLDRGASQDLVYDGARLIASKTTRLFDDGFTETQWRNLGFYPVLDQQNPTKSVMYRMLALKQDHPLPYPGSITESFDFSLNRDQQCPKQENFDRFASDYPLWGMPYGLPGLNSQEHQIMSSWLKRGSPPVALAPLGSAVKSNLEEWEAFLNGSSNKEKLMSRYLYEHLFLASLYFEDGDRPTWFRIVRSHTAPGRNIGLIATRRPYDDPNTKEFYYRLQRMPVTALDKRHMPYRLNQQRMNWYRDLFLSADYNVNRLPGYDPKKAANPFKTFKAIPVSSRYRFLLEEAQFSIMNFIKGPVCRGQIALSVIDDHFWVLFVAPNDSEPEQNALFLSQESDNLRLPTVATGTPVDLLAWRRYAKAEERYARAKADFMEAELDRTRRNLDINDIWDGDGRNDNASLTVFRHFDTASVVKGLVGETPKTAWVISYPLLERIHYLLVAGFDVHGGVSHQLESRLYMDFLRMEAELNFLMFLPPEVRRGLRDFWYRDTRPSIREHFFTKSEIFKRPIDIHFDTDNPKQEFLQRMRQRIHGATAGAYDYRVDASPDLVDALKRLEQNPGIHNSYLPQVSFVNVFGLQRDDVYTFIRNAGYSNIAQPFRDRKRRLPEEDTLTVARGFIGAYPNIFFQISEKQLPLFVDEVAKLRSKEDYVRLHNRFGVSRNAPWFWHISDKLHGMYREQARERAGLFDYNRYQHR